MYYTVAHGDTCNSEHRESNYTFPSSQLGLSTCLFSSQQSLLITRHYYFASKHCTNCIKMTKNQQYFLGISGRQKGEIQKEVRNKRSKARKLREVNRIHIQLRHQE